MSDTVTIIGSIASVIGAVIALVAAARARSARDAAEIAKNEAKSLQQVIHGERLHSEVRLARNTFAKYGPAASSTQLDGSDCTADADRAQRHLLSIKDLLPHAAQKSPVVEQILGRIPDHISMLTSAKRKDETKKAGNELYKDFDELLEQLRPSAGGPIA